MPRVEKLRRRRSRHGGGCSLRTDRGMRGVALPQDAFRQMGECLDEGQDGASFSGAKSFEPSIRYQR